MDDDNWDEWSVIPAPIVGAPQQSDSSKYSQRVMADYVHHGLQNATSIPLFTFASPPMEDNRIIRIALIGADLHENLKYEALSYVWGNLNDTLPIEVDSRFLRVTDSLDSFLRRLLQKVINTNEEQRGSGQSYLNVNFPRRSTQSVSGVYPDLAVAVKIASNDDQTNIKQAVRMVP
jgi:hypothetical protein